MMGKEVRAVSKQLCERLEKIYAGDRVDRVYPDVGESEMETAGRELRFHDVQLSALPDNIREGRERVGGRELANYVQDHRSGSCLCLICTCIVRDSSSRPLVQRSFAFQDGSLVTIPSVAV